MNSEAGFSTLFIIIMSVIALPIILIALFSVRNTATLSHQRHEIESQIADLHIAGEPQSNQCGGDGVDSNAWCDYKYSSSMSIIENALKAAGYQTTNSQSYQGNTEVTYMGGNPKVSFRVSSYNGTTTLYGELSK